jgi:hypothetical protein
LSSQQSEAASAGALEAKIAAIIGSKKKRIPRI